MRLLPRIAPLLLLLAACSHGAPDAERPAVKVNVMTVGAVAEAPSREYAGTVEEAYSADLSFATPGQVTAVLVKEGQQVAKGQLLARVDNARCLAAYRAAKASLDQAQDAYDRAKTLHDQGSLPDIKWAELLSQLDQARSMADLAQRNLDDCDLRAPANGVVGDRRIAPGTSVAAFQPVMTLLSMEGLYVATSLPEDDIAQVAIGTRARVLLGATGCDAVVEERNPAADPVTHTYTLRLRLLQPPADMLPGRVCKVRLAPAGADTTACAAVEIPARAVQLDNAGRRYVWVVADGRADQRPVVIGDLSRHGVIVTEGLRAGDLVITDGMLKVAQGSPVTPLFP